MKEADYMYGSVGVLGLFGILEVVQLLDLLLGRLAIVVSTPVMIWGGFGCIAIIYRAAKGRYGSFGDATRS